MLIKEVTSIDLDEKQIWGRKGTKLTRKYRCTSGRRKGRIVAKMAQCFAAPDMKKRMSMKKTRARLGARITRKTKRTKRLNPASRTLTRLNKRRR
jgi:hypothetical protein